jgi:hippurate hydrolase
VAVKENGPGPTIMVRTDLDGLPVPERTGLEYASQHTGLNDSGDPVPTMHACGHDLHMTSFLGAARILIALEDEWSGTLVMIGQPAEERGAGAKAMIDDGLYERFPRPEKVLALHTNSALEAGRVGLVSGYALANVDSVDITIRGKGGHGAWPHTTHDPVTLAAKVVMNLQTIVSRQVSPFDPAVVTVGSIHGGTKHNIIPDEVKLQLTVRSYKPEVRRLLLDSIRQTTLETARSAGFPPELEPIVGIREEEYTPSTYNDPEFVEHLSRVFTETFGEENVATMEPVMGGEDFSRFALEGEIPIAIFWLGSIDRATIDAAKESGRPLPSLHSAEFAPVAAPAIRTGASAMAAAVLDLMKPR